MIWYILGSTLTIAVMLVVYRIGFIKGYRKGALKVLDEWKEFHKEEIEYLEEMDNNERIL